MKKVLLVFLVFSVFFVSGFSTRFHVGMNEGYQTEFGLSFNEDSFFALNLGAICYPSHEFWKGPVKKADGSIVEESWIVDKFGFSVLSETGLRLNLFSLIKLEAGPRLETGIGNNSSNEFQMNLRAGGYTKAFFNFNVNRDTKMGVWAGCFICKFVGTISQKDFNFSMIPNNIYFISSAGVSFEF